MFDRTTKLILILAVLAAVLGGIIQRENRSPPPANRNSTIVGQLVPALALPDLRGRVHPLTEYRGRRVLINFWASWCGPCLEEMPALSQAQQKFGETDAIVLGIAMDEPDRVRKFIAAHPVGYPILLGRLEAPSTSLQLGDEYEILPFSVLIGADGHILAMQVGKLSAAQIDTWLAPAHQQP
ncbi:MAG: TlpA disulfide reductase family protein [Rhodanobacter sp.]